MNPETTAFSKVMEQNDQFIKGISGLRNQWHQYKTSFTSRPSDRANEELAKVLARLQELFGNPPE